MGDANGEGERKDVKQSNDEMHFPPGFIPLSHPSRPLGVHPEGNVERNVKNWGGKRNERTRARMRGGLRAGVLGGGSSVRRAPWRREAEVG